MLGSSITFEDYPLEQILPLMRHIGFTSVEMWKHHLRRCRTAELRRQFVDYARSAGIAMAGLNAVDEPYFLPFGSAEEWDKTLQGLKDDVDFALSLGVTDVLTFEGRRPANSSDDECLTRLLPRVIELFQQAISYAAPKGVRFLTEPHPFTVGMQPEFLLRLCDALPPEHFGVTCDFCHFGVGRPKDYIEVIRRLGRRIQHLHYSDSDQISSELHFVPGEGLLDMQGILQALKDSGYRGKLTLDLYGYPTPVAGAKRAVASIPQACGFLGIAVR